MPLRYVLPRRARVWYEGHRATVGYVLLVAYVTLVGAAALNAISSEGRERDQKLNANRVQQTRQSCRERNQERAALRRTFQTQRAQTRQVPSAAFEQFQVSKREALERLTAAINEFHRLDCKARVRAVRDALD